MFEKIFSVSTKFASLNYSLLWNDYRPLPLSIWATIVTSSILSELNVDITHFNECLILLDGRFENLHTLRIKVHYMSSSSVKIDDKVWTLEKRFFITIRHAVQHLWRIDSPTFTANVKSGTVEFNHYYSDEKNMHWWKSLEDKYTQSPDIWYSLMRWSI